MAEPDDDESPQSTRLSTGRPRHQRPSRRPTSDAPAKNSDLPAAVLPGIALEARYQDLGEIARGGMGSIHRTHDAVLRRVVAKKVLHVEDASPDAELMFVEEAQITGQLEHPNIVPVYDMTVDPVTRQTFFTMKLLSGRTLARAIKELHANGFSDVLLEQILRVVLKVCDAVAFAHDHGVIHCDLKPANVMDGAHGQVYVMDWGIAVLRGDDSARGSPKPPTEDPAGSRVRVLREDGRDTTEIIGTLTFMAPEQAWGRTSDIDERTDVFGLGGILYQVLTDRAPRANADMLELLELARTAEIADPRTARPDLRLPDGLCDIAMKALALEPASRYPSVDALKADLERFLRGGGWFATQAFQAGEDIVREGEPGNAGYVIVSGTCEVSQVRDGQRRVLRSLGPGDVFGETSIVSGRARTATVTAIEDVRVKVITAEALERELSLNTWVGAFVRQLTHRFVEVEEALRRAEAAARRAEKPASESPESP